MLINCAANLTMDAKLSILNPVNVNGAINLIKLAKKLKIKKFIHISSIQVIGKPKYSPIKESHICEPLSNYHKSKLLAEQKLMNFRNNFEKIIIRIPSPIGIGLNKKKIFSIFIEHALKNKTLLVSGDQQRKQNFLDVRDLINAIELISCNKTKSGIYNIASNNVYSNLELAKIIKTILKVNHRLKSDIIITLKDSFEWKVCTQKAKKAFNFIQKHSISSSIKWLAKK